MLIGDLKRNGVEQEQLENVAITDVLPLKAARPCAFANIECSSGPGIPAT